MTFHQKDNEQNFTYKRTTGVVDIKYCLFSLYNVLIRQIFIHPGEKKVRFMMNCDRLLV